MPVFIVTGTNQWGNIKVYLHKTLEDMQAPTPFMTSDIDGNSLYSKMSGDHYNPPKKVELKKGDYIMLITEDDLRTEGARVCGHMHYFNGNELISVYTKKPFNIPIPNYPWRINRA